MCCVIEVMPKEEMYVLMKGKVGRRPQKTEGAFLKRLLKDHSTQSNGMCLLPVQSMVWYTAPLNH